LKNPFVKGRKREACGVNAGLKRGRTVKKCETTRKNTQRKKRGQRQLLKVGPRPVGALCRNSWEGTHLARAVGSRFWKKWGPNQRPLGRTRLSRGGRHWVRKREGGANKGKRNEEVHQGKIHEPGTENQGFGVRAKTTQTAKKKTFSLRGDEKIKVTDGLGSKSGYPPRDGGTNNKREIWRE